MGANNTLILVVIGLAVIGLLWYLNRKQAHSNEGEMYVPEHLNEHFTEHLEANQQAKQQEAKTQQEQQNIVSNAVVERTGTRLLSDLKGPGLNDIDLQGGVFESVTNEDIDKIINERSQKQLDFNNKDLLPQEVNKDWFESDFSNARIKIGNDNLINTDRFTIGVNTVGQSLKNPSYDLRPSPPCPKVTISPWNQSTIEPDYNIKPWY
jgi:hypothetical protein